MDELKKDKDDINSLCKKCFIPDTSDDGTSEPDRSLFIELYAQLMKYGRKVSNNYLSINSSDVDDIIQDAIADCIEQWRKSPKDNYKAYYSTAIRHAFDNANIKSENIKKNEISFDNITENEEASEQTINDRKQKKMHPELEPIIQQLDKLDLYYKKWCNGELTKGAHKKDESTIAYLSARLTLEMREDFLKWGEIIKQEYNRTYSFLNKQVLNMAKNLKKADIAALFGLSETRGTHIYRDFIDEL